MLETRHSVCPLDCPDTCSLQVHVEDGRVRALDASPAQPYTQGFICSKVRHFARQLESPERVLQPLLRTGPKGSGQFRPVSWEQAFEWMGDRLRAARDQHGAESIVPCSYGGSNGLLTHDALDARFFRRLGASRVARTLCAAATGAAAMGLYGKMAGVALPDYAEARLIVLWGVNPQASGIHLVPVIDAARKRGTRLIVIDPRCTQLVKRADLHLGLRPGTDLPLALSLVRWMFANGHADEAFLAQHTSGVERLRERAEPWTITRAAAVCGLRERDIEQLALLYAETRPAVLRCGWGLERNRNGGSAVASVLALPAIAGHFGVRGGGYTMSNSAAWRRSLGNACNEPEPKTRELNLSRLGRDLCELRDPPIQFLFVYNCNPLATVPDQERVRRGLAREDLATVVFDQVLTDSALFADLVLPATSFLEHDELKVSYGSYALMRSRPAIAPMGEARTNNAVFAELERRLGLAREGDVNDAEGLVCQVLAPLPDAQQVRERLDRGESIPPPGGAHPVQFVDAFPCTADRKVHLFPEELEREAPQGLYVFQSDPASASYPLALISPATEKTISSTFGNLLRGKVALGLHPLDARQRGIGEGERVRVFNEQGELVVSAHLDPDLRPGVVFFPKGMWARHSENGNTANALAPDSLTDLGRGACYNDARVEVERSE